MVEHMAKHIQKSPEYIQKTLVMYRCLYLLFGPLLTCEVVTILTRNIWEEELRQYLKMISPEETEDKVIRNVVQTLIQMHR